MRYAGVGIRFAAVFLDSVLLTVVGIVVALLDGGGYAAKTPDGANAGVDLEGRNLIVWLVLALAYYVVTEAAIGGWLGSAAATFVVHMAPNEQLLRLVRRERGSAAPVPTIIRVTTALLPGSAPATTRLDVQEGHPTRPRSALIGASGGEVPLTIRRAYIYCGSAR